MISKNFLWCHKSLGLRQSRNPSTLYGFLRQFFLNIIENYIFSQEVNIHVECILHWRNPVKKYHHNWSKSSLEITSTEKIIFLQGDYVSVDSIRSYQKALSPHCSINYCLLPYIQRQTKKKYFPRFLQNFTKLQSIYKSSEKCCYTAGVL